MPMDVYYFYYPYIYLSKRDLYKVVKRVQELF